MNSGFKLSQKCPCPCNTSAEDRTFSLLFGDETSTESQFKVAGFWGFLILQNYYAKCFVPMCWDFRSMDSNDNEKQCHSRCATVDTYVWARAHHWQLQTATGGELAVCHEDSHRSCLSCVITLELSYDVSGGRQDLHEYMCRIFTFILDEDVYLSVRPACLPVVLLVVCRK